MVYRGGRTVWIKRDVGRSDNAQVTLAFVRHTSGRVKITQRPLYDDEIANRKTTYLFFSVRNFFQCSSSPPTLLKRSFRVQLVNSSIHPVTECFAPRYLSHSNDFHKPSIFYLAGGFFQCLYAYFPDRLCLIYRFLHWFHGRNITYYSRRYVLDVYT